MKTFLQQVVFIKDEVIICNVPTGDEGEKDDNKCGDDEEHSYSLHSRQQPQLKYPSEDICKTSEKCFIDSSTITTVDNRQEILQLSQW